MTFGGAAIGQRRCHRSQEPAVDHRVRNLIVRVRPTNYERRAAVTPGGGALPLDRYSEKQRDVDQLSVGLLGALSRSLWERCSFRPQRRSPCSDLAAPASWAHPGGTGATSGGGERDNR